MAENRGGKRVGSGRKPDPLPLLDNSTNRKTKNTLKDLKENQIVVNSYRLETPQDLSPDAKVEWERIINLYDGVEAKILTDLDVQAMRMYCEHTVLYNKASSAIGQMPSILSMDKETQNLINRLLKTMNDSAKVIISLTEQLCLTPVGRARMGYASVSGSKKSSKAESKTKKSIDSMSDFMSSRRTLI